MNRLRGILRAALGAAVVIGVVGCGSGGGGGLINFDFSRVVKGQQALPSGVPTKELSGKVVDEQGNAISGASISIKATAWPNNYTVTGQEAANVATSDDQGRYSISSLPGKLSYLITARKEGYESAAEPPGNDEPGKLTVRPEESGFLEDPITLRRKPGPDTGDVSGRVYDAATRKPLKDATVASGGKQATADAQGRYTLQTLEAGTATLTATATGYQDGERTVTVPANDVLSGADLYLLPDGATPPGGPGW